VGDSSTTSWSTIKAQKDAEDEWGRGGAYISLALDPCLNSKEHCSKLEEVKGG
jgi:hypothetical protein